MKDRNNVLGILAFVALFLAGVMKILNATNLNLGSVGTVLQIIGELSLVLTVVIAAHPFAKGLKSIVWYIIYWVLAIIAVVGVVYGGVALI